MIILTGNPNQENTGRNRDACRTAMQGPAMQGTGDAGIGDAGIGDVEIGDVEIGDVGTYRQVRPTCQPAEGCYYKERMPLHLRRPTLCIPSFNKSLCAVPASVHFEKQRTHLVGTSLHLLADRQPKSRIWRKRKKENTANVSLYVFNIF